MLHTRRQFLARTSTFALGMAGLRTFLARRDAASLLARPARFGPLIPDPNKVLDLPEGFTYAVISRVGETMDDGFLVPGYADGMAAFPGPDDLTILICNHEIDFDMRHGGAFGPDNERLDRVPDHLIYDRGALGRPALGGTTTILYDTRTRRVERRYLSLCGTTRNCAGGPTPWGTWITCEEYVAGVGGPHARSHGWCFEVPARAEPGLTTPIPITAMGRFNHEAVAVNPATSVVYLTEDRNDGVLYRFIPDRPEFLHMGGRLQALAIRGHEGIDTRNWEGDSRLGIGTRYALDWIDLDAVDAPEDDLRHRAHAAGAARFARGEGMWFGMGAIYFACTTGGRNRLGQIWRITPSPHEATPDEVSQPATIDLFIEPDDTTLCRNADNLTVAPWGDVIVCEDGDGHDRLFGVTPGGEVYQLARNALNTSELAGCVFSPDGSTLFVNNQQAGMTFAIRGRWPRT